MNTIVEEKSVTPGETTAPPQVPAPGTTPPRSNSNTSQNSATGKRDAAKITTSGLANVVTHSADNPTPTQPRLPKASTNIEWEPPIGLHLRDAKNEPLMVFRRAVGINSDLAPPTQAQAPSNKRTGTGTGMGMGMAASLSPGQLERGQSREPVGMYRAVIAARRRRRRQHAVTSWCLNAVHFAQIVLGAALTALGPNAGRYAVPITVLGAANTVMAGLLALLKGQGLPERLHKDRMAYERLQQWVEETEALLATGVIGRGNRDVGVLVESAFKKFNSAKLSEENNRPDNYVPDPGTADGAKKKSHTSHDIEDSKAALG